MAGRLTQHGVAAITPLVTARTAAGARELATTRLERLDRVVREACKQSGRLWLPLVNPPRTPAELAASAGTLVTFDRGAGLGFSRWLARSDVAWTSARPLRLILGPEGGLDDAELACLAGAGAIEVHLGPHVLRIETAAEAALAIASEALFTRSRS
jgi:16S rRNA (uracil1498-N3)-methyltransferase